MSQSNQGKDFKAECSKFMYVYVSFICTEWPQVRIGWILNSPGCPSQLQAICADLKARAIESHVAALASMASHGGAFRRSPKEKKTAANSSRLRS